MQQQGLAMALAAKKIEAAKVKNKDYKLSDGEGM